MVYMKIKAQSIGASRDPYDIKNPIFLKWEKLVADYNKDAPKSMQSLEQTAGQFWAWMPSEKAFVSSAFQGMTIAGIFSFFVLVIATGNII